MLFECDFCQNKMETIIKLPCGYHVEYRKGQTYLVYPQDESVYRNICLACLLGE